MPNEIVPRTSSGLPAVPASDVVEAFLAGRKPRTLKSYKFDLSDFARFAGAPSEAAAAELLLAAGHGEANRVALAYLAHMKDRKPKLATATVARRLATLRSMVKFARMTGRVAWSLDVKSDRVKPYRDTSGPGDEGWSKIRTKARELASTPDTTRRPRMDRSKRDLALVLLLHNLGLRRGECVALDLDDVRLDESKVMVIGKGKTEEESLTLPHRTREALADWIETRGEEPGPLFVRMDPAADGGLQRLTGDSVWRMVKKLSKRAGLKREAKPHGLRHHAITSLDEKTNSNRTKMQRFSRHAKGDTLDSYIDNRRDDAGAMAQLLDDDE
jgi:integrase/recombinase XerC